ncbi:hypothetical protein CMV_024077 [Castanea mollissima]|uniref:Uncharacterized protein n=1 Tax=Castanea mollissima TaxID=60419 RepID=A0A8J4QB69_9ROSI|nr:hypothetical protein CMV_024077 [Castanea mollissima]
MFFTHLARGNTLTSLFVILWKLEFNIAIDGETTDCYSFCPKHLHNLSLIFFSFSPFIIFSHRSDFLSSKIHLWDFVSKLRAYNKNSLGEYCNVEVATLSI